MCKKSKGRFAKSESRYQFNLDCIEKKYCNAANRREMAREALQRDFGDACISSPVVELKDKSNTAVCERLNKTFEKKYGKRKHGGIRKKNARRSLAESDRKLRTYYAKSLWREQYAAIGKYTSSIAMRRNITNMVTDSVEDEEEGAKRPRRYEYNNVIDVIISPVKEGPIRIIMDNQLNNTLEQSSSYENETFLHAWFRDLEQYGARANFIRDRSFRSRAAYNAQRSANRNLGYVNISHQ